MAVLVVTILPLWALWVYAYATLESLQNEVEALARSYGMYLYKEQVQQRLEGAARVLALSEPHWRGETEGEGDDRLAGEEWERFRLLFGPEEEPILVERTDVRVLFPVVPPYGTASFLDEPDSRTAFLRTLQSMVKRGVRGGYFSVDSSDVRDPSSRRGWFLALAPVGEDLLCVLPVPEEQVRLSGGILQEAQADLLKEKRKRFVYGTVPVVVLSSLFIGVLYRRTRRPNLGGDT